MAASFTDNPAWIMKMKERFPALDVDKNGAISKDDIAELAKKLAGYQKEGKDAEKQYFDTVKSIWLYGIGEGTLTSGINEDEFIQGMKQSVTQPDAREHVKTYSAMVFGLIDADKDGVVNLMNSPNFKRQVPI